MNPVNTEPYKLPGDATWLGNAALKHITGCSSGIGRAIASLIASKPNQRIIATARNPADLSYLPEDNANILKLALDVTSVNSVNAAFAAAAKHFGESFHLDVVVNNAGYSLSGDTEGATEEEMHQEMETSFFGTVRVTTRSIEVMRQAKDRHGGLIFQISSLAGLCAFPGHAFYHAINFCIVEPSGVKTSFEGHSKAIIKPHPAYAGADMPARKLEGYVRQGLKLGMGMEPSAIAETLFKIASREERIPLRLPLGAVSWKMSKSKFQTLLEEFDAVKDVSAMGEPL
ncbi:hypothetical protein PENANT_c002G11303 [Penicillium antarcticum]|uniref:Uncharacterized protein n=1 Tax=Penicillium antarcticum TaxID=416450 RepID=A0A1V6QJM0_9EURO|nr:hypothetical protein PENANT_c002G11303 [Penicillium antarcticum]